MFDFEKLIVYQKAKVYQREIKKVCVERRQKIDTFTHNQIRRAAQSIVLNIAEGSGRFTKPDKRNFYVIARGSVFETVALLDDLSDDEVLNHQEYMKLYELAEELSKMLYSMIGKEAAKWG